MVGWSHVDGTVVRWRARAKHPRRRRRRQSAVRSSQPHPCHQPDEGGGSGPLRLRQLRACTRKQGRGDGLDLVWARMRLVSVSCRVGCGWVASPASSRRNDSRRHDTSQPKIASVASMSIICFFTFILGIHESSQVRLLSLIGNIFFFLDSWVPIPEGASIRMR